MAQSRQKMKGIGKAISIKVKFLVSCGDGKFKAGDIVELNAPSAYHWIKRGKAERYVKSSRKKKTKSKEDENKKQISEENSNENSGTSEMTRTPPITVTDPTPEITRE